jgi:hypothetical protein
MSQARYLKTISLGIVLTVLVARVGYGNLLLFDNEAADNDWNNAANWFDFTTSTNDVLPGPSDQTLINGDNLAKITTNSAFAPSQVWLSNASGGNLDIQANLTAGSGMILGLSGQSTNPAKVTQSAGTVVGTGFIAIAGAAGNAPLSPSIYQISGGSLSSPSYSVGTVGFGTLSIVGTAPTVSASGTAIFGVGSTLEFILGSSGVSPFVAQFTNNHLTGSKLVVDGSAYTGGAAIIPLVQVNATDNPFANVVVSGFGSMSAVVTQQGGDVLLTIVPEPSCAIMASLVAVLGMVFHPRPANRTHELR